MYVIIITGPPGSGKGTQAKLLAGNFGLLHLSTGEMLRKEIASGSELGKLAQSRIDDGNFVPDYIACQMVEFFLENNSDLKGLIFDGFPRTLYQCGKFDQILSKFKTKVHLFIDIDVEEKKLTQRLLNRNEKEKRPDDSNISIIKHRFDLYNEHTKPIIGYYKDYGCYCKVNGNNSIDEVNYLINNVIKEYIKI